MIHYLSLIAILFAVFSLFKKGSMLQKAAAGIMALALLNRSATVFFFMDHAQSSYMVFWVFLFFGSVLTAIAGMRSKSSSVMWLGIALPLLAFTVLWNINVRGMGIQLGMIIPILFTGYLFLKKRNQPIPLLSCALSCSVVAIYYFAQFIEYLML
jgi:hypothetical protein